MTKLLEKAVERLSHLSETAQDREARAILERLQYVGEEPVDEEQPASLLALVGAGVGVYGNEEEIDAYVRAERDAWDS